MKEYVFLCVTAVLMFILTYALTGVVCLYALRKNVIDKPGDRSSHQVDTPRAGGVSIVLAVLLAGVSNQAISLFNFPVALFLPLLLVALVGLIDDVKNISALSRFCAHAIAGLFVVVHYFPLPELTLAFFSLPSWLVSALAVVGIVWSINLFNFMDGINGLATTQAMFVFCGFAMLAFWWGGDSPISSSFWILTAVACAGFLFWNFPVAKIFMGDACSGFLGLFVAIGLVNLLNQSQQLFAAGLILYGVFIVDATSTLIVRFLRGERVQAAHRSHAYQKASRRLKSHTKVTLAVGVLNVCWMAPWALFVASSAVPIWLGLACAYFLPLVAVFYCKSGVDESLPGR